MCISGLLLPFLFIARSLPDVISVKIKAPASYIYISVLEDPCPEAEIPKMCEEGSDGSQAGVLSQLALPLSEIVKPGTVGPRRTACPQLHISEVLKFRLDMKAFYFLKVKNISLAFLPALFSFNYQKIKILSS